MALLMDCFAFQSIQIECPVTMDGVTELGSNPSKGFRSDQSAQWQDIAEKHCKRNENLFYIFK